jgi:hypothetical protein
LVGLIPYSSVGYKIKYDAENDTENSRRFNGTGGLNKAFLGVGYQIRNLNWCWMQIIIWKNESNSLIY